MCCVRCLINESENAFFKFKKLAQIKTLAAFGLNKNYIDIMISTCGSKDRNGILWRRNNNLVDNYSNTINSVISCRGYNVIQVKARCVLVRNHTVRSKLFELFCFVVGL